MPVAPMSRHRKRPDGLPHRVYERFGTRTYSTAGTVSPQL